MDGPALSPRLRGGSVNHTNVATERSRQRNAARLLSRSSELLHMSRAFAAWAAATRERKLKGHMNRCATMLKHNAMRHDYSRFFLRWLAHTQGQTAESYRNAIELRRDVPLRSKADFLALARRYFAKWRLHLRETKQRTHTNVDLLAALNRERLRSRALLRWWRLCRAKAEQRHHLETLEHQDTIRRLQHEVRRAVNEAEDLRDRLSTALQAQARLEEELSALRGDHEGTLQQRQLEISDLRQSMRSAITMVEGDDGPGMRALRKMGAASPARGGDGRSGSESRSHDGAADRHRQPSTHTTEPPKSSALQSRETQAALLRCIEEAATALADLSRSAAPPASVDAAIAALRQRLAEDAEELAAVTAQRDELVAAARAARRVMVDAALSPQMAASSLIESELGGSRATSVASARHGGAGASPATTSARRSAQRGERGGVSFALASGGRRATASSSTSAAAIIGNSLPVVYLHSGPSTPNASLPGSPGEVTLAEYHELPRLLVADAQATMASLAALRKNERRATAEVADLQDAALRALDALGGSGVSSDDFTAAPDEALEARAQRSGGIATGLRNLCEDMIVVLVLTSLWSGKRASERVSEALERLWYRTQDLEATHGNYLKQLDDLLSVVHVAARTLRRPPAPTSTASTPRGHSPRTAVPALARRRHSAVPREEEGPPTAEEASAALRSAEAFAAKGDALPAELLRLCADAVQKTAAQSLVQTSELEGLLRGAQELLAATVGAAERDSASASMTDLPATPVSSPTAASAAASPSEVTLALRGAVRRVARLLGKAGDAADTPLVTATQRLMDELEQARRAQQDAAKQLRAMEAKAAAAEAQRAKEVAKAEAAEQKLRSQLETVTEQCKESEAARRELDAHLREVERAHKRQLDEQVKEQRAAVKEVEQQLKAVEKEMAQQEKEHQRQLEKEAKAMQRALDEEVAAHARTQADLDAQLKAALAGHEESDVAVARLEEELRTLKAEHQQAVIESKRLEEMLQQEKEEHVQVQRDREEEREEAETAKQLHAEEVEKMTEAQEALEEEKHTLEGELERLRSQMEQAAEEQSARSTTQLELEARLESMARQMDEHVAARRALEQQLSVVEGENRVNNAVGIFLRDVLRDCLTRLHHLTRDVDAAAAPLSPRESLTLQQARDSPPPLLTHDSDPSEYVEYILRLDGNSSAGKRLVQEHLRENAAVHVAAPSPQFEATAGDASSAAALSLSSQTAAADPSTWEVVAEMHDRLVLLYEYIASLDQLAAEQRTANAELSGARNRLCADALTTLRQLQPWSTPALSAARAARASSPQPTSPTTPVALSDTQAESDGPAEEARFPPTPAAPSSSAAPIDPSIAGPALCASSAEVAEALAALRKVADVARPLVQLRAAHTPSSRRASASASGPADGDGAASAQLQALVMDMEDMASCLQHLSATVQQGILVLGGATDDEAAAAAAEGGATGSLAHGDGSAAAGAAGKAGGKMDSRALAARLEAICAETGTSILEVKHLLLGDGAAREAPSKPLKLREVIPQVRAKMVELEQVKKDSARLLLGLNRAFDDDEDSLFAASLSSTQSRSLRPKRKPLPAFQGTPEAGLRLMQQQMKGKKARRSGAASVNSVSQLNSVGHNIRERLGDLQNLRLACRTTLQVLEGKAHGEGEGGESGQPPTYGDALVTLLTTQVADLRVAITESNEALKGYRRDVRGITVGTRLHLLADIVNSLKLERDSLKEDLARRGRQSNMLLDELNKENQSLKAELLALHDANAQLSTTHNDAASELETQKKNAAELAARLAQLQHESNVLSTALATVLRGLPASPFSAQPAAAVEKSVQAALKTEHGDALTRAVDEAVAATAQQQQALRNTFHERLAEVRGDLQGLRQSVAQCWADYGAPLADAAALAVTETAEVLTLENAMLRPRAVEREKLRGEVAELTAALDEAADARDLALRRLGEVDDENTQLRRALRDAEMSNILNGADGSNPPNNNNGGGDGSRATLGDPREVDWERRMIAGAADLAMDAIDSMSGKSMTAVFGAVTEETLRIYKGVRESLRRLKAACAATRGTDGRRLLGEVEARLLELDTLSSSADYLRTRLPVLYRTPYE